MCRSRLECIIGNFIGVALGLFVICILAVGIVFMCGNFVGDVNTLSFGIYRDNNTVQGDLYMIRGYDSSKESYVSDIIDVTDIEVTNDYVRYITDERSIKLLTNSENAVVEYMDGTVGVIYGASVCNEE